MPPFPTFQKLHKLTHVDHSRMQVLSINDFDRAQEAQLENIMDSAVDQLESLTKPPGERPTVADAIVHFGQLRLSDEVSPLFRFDFEPPTTCSQWPGPRYGSFSLHKPLPSMPKKSKSKTKSSKTSRKHAQPDDFKQSVRPVKAPKPKKTKKMDVAPVMLSAKSSRDPPLQLMVLPPELRNSIWSLLAVRHEPIKAELRPIQPCKKLSKHRGTIVRRFPLEPVVARVNQQVRREVLSIFYGDNHFIFQNNRRSETKGLSITHPAVIQEWKPRQEVANYLTELELKFNTTPRPMGGKYLSLVFLLRKLPDSKIAIEVKAEEVGGKAVSADSWPCLCEEQDVIKAVQEDGYAGDLVSVAMQLTTMRTKMQFNGIAARGMDYSPDSATCKRCERATFGVLFSL